MKILFVADNYPPFGTAEAFCNAKLVMALRACGHMVDVVSRQDAAGTYFIEWTEPWLPLQEDLYSIGVPYRGRIGKMLGASCASVSLHSYPMNGIRWARLALQEAKKLHGKNHYELVMSRSWSDVSHIVGRNFARWAKIPWFANWNDPAVPILPSQYKPDLSRLTTVLYNRTLESCMREASVHTFPSRELREYFRQHYPVLWHKCCKVVPHVAMTEEAFSPFAVKRSASREFRMCHAGMLNTQRDPELLFDAIRQVMQETGVEIRLDIIGTDNPAMHEMIGRYGLHDNISYKGKVSFAEALRLEGVYDVLLLVEARLEKGIFFASKLVDYAQAGRPVFAVSPADGFANRIITAVGGGEVVDNEDKNSIVEGLKKMVLAWQQGKLDEAYPARNLYLLWSVQTVMSKYQRLFEDFVQK